ncbi:MAG: glycosyltransferase family 2 protein [Candidatus Rokuibacteriota bacterium]
MARAVTPHGSGSPDVSIIICTWNNCRRLAVTLDALARCATPSDPAWDLVLVDNNCRDETPAVARAFRDRLPLVYVEERRQGLSRARNAGLRAAAGRLIVFADDDITPATGWLTIYWTAYLERPRGFYFGGPLVPEFESAPPEPALGRLAHAPVTGLDWGSHPRVLEPHERFLGANWACPADALRRVGGFDVELGLDASLGRRRVGEEWDLMERLRAAGIRPWYLPDARVAHFVPERKCRLPYLASNWEAHGHASTLRATTNTPFFHRRPHLRPICADGGPRIAGAPLRAYLAAGRFGLRWLAARARGRDGYEEYATWRFCLGAIRGHGERWRQRSDPARGSSDRAAVS